MTGTGGPVPKSDGTGAPLQGQLHDFYYTSVARYLFRYAGVPSTLSFVGSDDLWVYLNGKLKLDLGGTHERAAGIATIGDLADALARSDAGGCLAMPLSRPMPSIGPQVHELRLRDRTGTYRVI